MNVDTIAAISTAPGFGAIGVVRISGPDALGIFQALVPDGPHGVQPRSVNMVELCDPTSGEPIDRAVATFFQGPASYTGEDIVELSCHGGLIVPQTVLHACVAAGARQAEPGEFTRRAYLHGKMDLIQAEAVGDLVHARSRALHRAALGQLDRGLSERVASLRGEILKLEAQLVHHIDFPEEDDAPIPVEGIAEAARTLCGTLDQLLSTAPEGELLREGALTVLAGRPNAGKSSLYNALIGQERAIVTEEPGTTRDALEAVAQIGGFPFRLVDTAGLREGGGRIEQMGIEVAQRFIHDADMLLYCAPADEPLSASDVDFMRSVDAPVVLVRTKVDALPDSQGEPVTWGEGDLEVTLAGIVEVSAHSGRGFDVLRELLPSVVFSGLVGAHREDPVLTRKRHADALRTARDEVGAFAAALDEGVPPEMASTHLRPAESALEEVLGVISVDDVLDVVFREFCVGK